MDFNKIFKYSWDLFLKDVVPLIVGGLIAGILGVITLGVLIGPLYGGLVKMIIRRVRENRPAEIRDVFSAMDQFGTLFITTLVLGILITIGFFLCIIPGLLLATIWMYVYVFIIDKKVSMGDAMSLSKKLVSQNGFGMHLVVLLILGVISGILSITYIGSFVASPFILVVICVMYFIFNSEEHLLSSSNISPSPQQSSSQNNAQMSIEQNQNLKPVSPIVSTPQPDAGTAPLRAMAVCAACGKKAGNGAFCTECGAQLNIVCSNCKKKLVPGARFCPSCGLKLE